MTGQNQLQSRTTGPSTTTEKRAAANDRKLSLTSTSAQRLALVIDDTQELALLKNFYAKATGYALMQLIFSIIALATAAHAIKLAALPSIIPFAACLIACVRLPLQRTQTNSIALKYT